MFFASKAHRVSIFRRKRDRQTRREEGGGKQAREERSHGEGKVWLCGFEVCVGGLGLKQILKALVLQAWNLVLGVLGVVSMVLGLFGGC